MHSILGCAQRVQSRKQVLRLIKGSRLGARMKLILISIFCACDSRLESIFVCEFFLAKGAVVSERRKKEGIIAHGKSKLLNIQASN